MDDKDRDRTGFRVVSRIEDFKQQQNQQNGNRAPIPELVEELEALLEEARSGRCRAVSYVSIHGGKGAETSNMRCIGTDYMMIMHSLACVMAQRIGLQILSETEQQG